MSVAASDKTKPYLPVANLTHDGWSNDHEATATCYSGAVQIVFPTEAPGYVGSFICNCVDCRKITASMFASNFTVRESHAKHVRGQDNLKTFGQSKTIITPGNTMTNYFCGTCGSLLYRKGGGFPGMLIMRLGTVDDFNLVEGKLKPDVEQFTKDRVAWLYPAEGVPQCEGYYYADK
uniref:WGS project CBMG000000000 data, contig CS5907-c002361 n=1 Tax=Fusarium acuminatum CS5907 TaxID=1318461 RepID=A0A090N523_9HYPO|nr:unnamed protein product [Fusarium acuminatum CS5907]